MVVLRWINTLLTYISLILIRLYQKTISPSEGLLSWWLKDRICMHEPHCSRYAQQCLRRYGFWKSLFPITDRVLHCTGGMHKIYDPASYKVVFFSSAPIGVPFMEALFQDPRFDVTGIVSMPDAPAGRGMKMQENIIKTKAKEYITQSIVRYFFLADSLQAGWQDIFAQYNIQRHWREDWGVIVYTRGDQHTTLVPFFQKLMISGPWYFDTRGAHNLIIFKDAIFDLNRNESEAAKDHGRRIGIPEAQLDWSTDSNDAIRTEMIQTPSKINPEKSDEGKAFAQRLTDKKPDYIVVIAYGKIIPQSILDIPTIAPINVHGSLLPKYRGASPIQSIFLNNEKETGITIMKMAASLDTGDMVAKKSFSIPFSRTSKDIITKMQEIGPDFLTDTLRKLGKGLYGYEKQDDSKATLCGKIEKEDGLIDPYIDSMQSIYQKYRAYALWPKIYFVHEGKRFVIESLTLDEILYNNHSNQPMITTDKKLHPAIQHISIKPEGKKAMSWNDFKHGYIK